MEVLVVVEETGQLPQGRGVLLFGVAMDLRDKLGVRLLTQGLNPEVVRVGQKLETQGLAEMAELGLLIGKNI
jgi:hypothetical protein